MLKKVTTKFIKRDVLKKIDCVLEEKYESLAYAGISETEKTITRIKKLFNLTENEIKLCTYLFLIEVFEPLELYFDRHLMCKKYMARSCLCNIININKNDLNEIYSSKLVKTGLIKQRYGDEVELSDDIKSLFQEFFAQTITQKYYSKV